MARETCDSNSRHSMIQTNLSGTVEVEFMMPRHAWRLNHLEYGSNYEFYRVDDGALLGFDSDAGQAVNRLPTWMRMTRIGSLITTELSFEDESGVPLEWETVGSDSHPDRPDKLLLGLALTGHTGPGGNTGTVVFDQLSIENYDPGEDS